MLVSLQDVTNCISNSSKVIRFAAAYQQAIVSANCNKIQTVRYSSEIIGQLNIFYREAGDPNEQPVVLLHGFPTSSYMYRDVLATLGDEFYVIAPDYPGFSDSSFPPTEEYSYTFDNITNTIYQFLVQKGITKFVLMMQDYGAPVGFRIANKYPERVNDLIAMNGNAYEEGLGEGWGPIPEYWKNKSPELEKTIIENVFTLDGMKWQYTHGTHNPMA